MKDLWSRFIKWHGNIFMKSHFCLFITIIKAFWLPRYGWPDWKTNDPTEKETSVIVVRALSFSLWIYKKKLGLCDRALCFCVSGQFSIGHFSTPIFWQTFPDQDISRPGDISRPRHFSTQTFLDQDISRPGQKSTRQFLTDIKVGLVTHSWHLPYH